MFWQILKIKNGNLVDDDLFALACGPDHRITKYSACIVNGVRFCTAVRGANKKRENGGIMIASTYGEDEDLIACHGTLKEIIMLQYHGDRSVVLFRCAWFTPEEKTALKNDRSSKNTPARSRWTKDDTLVLAMHAKKVFPFSGTTNGEYYNDNCSYGEMNVDSDQE